MLSVSEEIRVGGGRSGAAPGAAAPPARVAQEGAGPEFPSPDASASALLLPPAILARQCWF